MTFQTLAPVRSTRLNPYFPIPVPAGHSSTVEQQVEWINIDEYLRSGSDAVAYIRVRGDSMVGDRISDGDILVVQRCSAARAGDVVIAEINGEFTVKRLREHSHGLYLVPANDAYPLRKVSRQDSFAVWAVVKFVIHSF